MKKLALIALALSVLVGVTADARSGGGRIASQAPRIGVAPMMPSIANDLGIRPRINRHLGDLTPRFRRDIGLHAHCRYVPVRNELGVVFHRRTNCVLQ